MIPFFGALREQLLLLAELVRFVIAKSPQLPRGLARLRTTWRWFEREVQKPTVARAVLGFFQSTSDPTAMIPRLHGLMTRVDRDRYPTWWGVFAHMYGALLAIYPPGEPGEALEEAVATLEAVKTHAARHKLRTMEALTDEALARAYLSRRRGSAKQNIETAVALLEQRVLPAADQVPAGVGTWRRRALRLLGEAYHRREVGDVLQNRATAVRCYEAALREGGSFVSSLGYVEELLTREALRDYSRARTLLGLADALSALADAQKARGQDAGETVRRAAAALVELFGRVRTTRSEARKMEAVLPYTPGTFELQRLHLTAQLQLARLYVRDPEALGPDAVSRGEAILRVTAQTAIRQGNGDLAAEALTLLGTLLYDNAHYTEAINALEGAVRHIERLRSAAMSPERRAQVLRGSVQVYERIILALMRAQRVSEALAYAERGRSRSLLDLISLRDVRPRNVSEEVLREYEEALVRTRTLDDSLRLAEERFGDRDPGGLSGWEARASWIEGDVQRRRRELLRSFDQLHALTERIRRQDPDFLPHASPLSTEGMAALARDVDATLLLFRVTGEGTFAFFVGADGVIDSVGMRAFTTARLDALLVSATEGWSQRYHSYRTALTSLEPERILGEMAAWMRTMESTLSVLSSDLLAPVLRRLREIAAQSPQPPVGAKPPRLVIVPSRGLAILPLHACWWEEAGRRRHLLDEFTIMYAPSLSVLYRCAAREAAGRSHDSWLSVANPVPPGDLGFAEWECAEIEALLGHERSLVLRRDAATKAEFLRWSGQHAWLHLACHGEYRLDAPLESRLSLANAEDLTLGEIMERLHLPHAWLVVLSACETGLVDFREIADEHYGLPLGFLFGGAPTVWATQWAVTDESAALLMVQAYEGLVHQGLSKPESLRHAQRWLRDATASELLDLLAERPSLGGVGVRYAAPLRRRLQFGYRPDERPFAHPFYWAGVQCVGV